MSKKQLKTIKPRQQLRNGLILISFFLFPATFYYFSPVLIIMASSQGIVNGSFVIFLLMFISSLLFGRGFCGWVCPGAGCQEAIFLARNQKVTGGDSIKWFIWLPWVGFILLLAIRSGGYREIDFFFQTTCGLSVSNIQGLISYLLVLFLLIVLPAFVFGKRSFCHHLCWMAPFMILGRNIRNYFQWFSLQLTSQPGLCKNCHSCTDHCPMSLPVEEMVKQNIMENKECVLCGTCIDACQQGAIRFSWRK